MVKKMQFPSRPRVRSGEEMPPFCPDPAIVGNAEGGRRALKLDQAAVQCAAEEVNFNEQQPE